jgi:vacuolar-type H+-ATPase subunit H
MKVRDSREKVQTRIGVKNMSTHEKSEQNVDTVVDKAQDMAEQVGDEAKQKVSETTAAAKVQAKRVAAQVGEQAKSTVETRKSDVAQELGSVADVVRQTTYEAGSGTSPTIMEYGQRIADQIEGVSSYLDEHGVEDILSDVQNFGRRKPAVFLGGAFMLGLVVGRFLRSSAGRTSAHEPLGYDTYEEDYRDSGYSGRHHTGYQRSTVYPTATTTTTDSLNVQD